MRKTISPIYFLFLINCLNGIACNLNVAATFDDPLRSAFNYLTQTFDQCHEYFYVYKDAGSACNHFNLRSLMPNESAFASMDECYKGNPHSGSTCIQCTYEASGRNWGGFFFQNGVMFPHEATPRENWGDYPNAGYDLTGATELTFWAKGHDGGEQVRFDIGGIGWRGDTPAAEFPESIPRISTGYIQLSSEWNQYSIDLSGKDLSYVLGGFSWVTSSGRNNGQNVVFYLDDIRFDKSRLDEKRFLVSYEQNAASQHASDISTNGVAFTYDNALALLAFLARGEERDLENARLLADGFVFVSQNDPIYNDGRLWNAYMGGDLVYPPGWRPYEQEGVVRFPGFWNCDDGRWYENSLLGSSHAGNAAWGIIALCAAYHQVGVRDYLNTSIRLGNWLELNCKNDNPAGGFTAGFANYSSQQTLLQYKPVEHNIDLYVAFEWLFALTQDSKWRGLACHAKRFVEAMWDEKEGKLWAGTDASGIDIYKTVVPLDVQTWSVLACNHEIDRWEEALHYAERNHFVDGGFDFNRDQDGVWYEGTAQMACAYNESGRFEKSDDLLNLLEVVQTQFESGAIPAASMDLLSTGFGDYYFNRGHVGATAWYIFAKLNKNPYWIYSLLNERASCDPETAVELWREIHSH